MSYLFTSEAVSAGHPDKICDQISDTLLDLHLQADPCAHTAIETMATTNRVIIAGETLSSNPVDPETAEETVRTLIKKSAMINPGSVIRTCKSTIFFIANPPTLPTASKIAAPEIRGSCFGYAKKKRVLKPVICRWPFIWPTCC